MKPPTSPDGNIPQAGQEDIPFIKTIRKVPVREFPASLRSFVSVLL